MKRLVSHWHHAASVTGLLLAGILLGAGGQRAVEHFRQGGFRPGPLPPQVRVFGGHSPSSVSLAHYLTRIHNQGNSNSCVGQTIATMAEITNRQRHPHQWRKFSAGYIWNQIDRGRNQGITYQAAFDLLLHAGDATLKTFPWDGASGWGIQPNAHVRALAFPHRFSSWRSIAPGDRSTMEYELSHNRPIAVAIPVTDSFYSLWLSKALPVVDAQWGQFHFWHSITGIGYTPTGLITLNSWGPRYGFHGRAILTWHFLTTVGAAIVVAQPLPLIRRLPPLPPRPPLPPKPPTRGNGQKHP